MSYNQDIKDEILRITDGGRMIFEHYLDKYGQQLKKFYSPFYEDTHASCEVRKSKKSGKWNFIDYGDSTYDGDCFTFVAHKYGLKVKDDFVKIMHTIIQEMNLPIEIKDKEFVAPKPLISSTYIYKPRKVSAKSTSEVKSFNIVAQNFFESELLFWNKYGIDIDTLKRYNVISVKSYCIINKEVGNTYRPMPCCSMPGNPIFAYKGDKYYKIYRPEDKRRFCWLGEKPEEYYFGYDQLPECGTTLFITGGEKDVLSLAAHGFNAISLNSETALLPESVMTLLRSRFLHIFIMYDADETGVREMAKRCEEHPDLIPLHLPLAGTKKDKDISDFFASGKRSEDFSRIVDQKLCKILESQEMLLKDCEVNFKNPGARSEIIVSVNDVPLGCTDNILCVSGGEGTGKSHFVSGLVSGALRIDKTLGVFDTFGVNIAPNVNEKAVLHFDTEQSTPQLCNNSEISLRRAELLDYPDYYHAFSLTHLKREDRYSRIRAGMDKYNRIHHGIQMVVIDGVADLVKSANDENGSITLVEDIYRLARIFHTCVICVVHFVPNGLKLRGHLGSELTRKASAILSIEKDQTGVYSVMKALKVREGSPTEVPQLMYAWDKELKMFKYQGNKTGNDKVNLRVAKLWREAKNVFGDKKRLTEDELRSGIMSESNVAKRTAGDHIDEMVSANIIEKRDDNYYIKEKPSTK